MILEARSRAMAAKLTKTTTPDICRRHAKDCDRAGRCECAYVVVFDDKAQTSSTLAEARDGKQLAQRHAKLSQAHAAGVHRDEPRQECPDCEQARQESDRDAPLLHGYALGWLARYHGLPCRNVP